jgi:hypothetical protein
MLFSIFKHLFDRLNIFATYIIRPYKLLLISFISCPASSSIQQFLLSVFEVVLSDEIGFFFIGKPDFYEKKKQIRRPAGRLSNNVVRGVFLSTG